MGGFPDFLTLNSVSFSVLSISHLPTTIHHPPFLSFKSFLSWCVWASEGILVIATIHWVLTMDTRFTYIVSFYPSSSAGQELLPDYKGGEYGQRGQVSHRSSYCGRSDSKSCAHLATLPRLSKGACSPWDFCDLAVFSCCTLPNMLFIKPRMKSLRIPDK